MTTDTTTTRTVAGKFLDALGRQDQDAIQDLFAESIDWYVPGSGTLPWTGRRSRRDEVAAYFSLMWPRYVHGKSEVSLEKTLIDNGDVVFLGTFGHTIAASGRQFTTPVAMHLVVEDGEITVLHLYEDTLTVAEAFELA
ncbi:nuclear transport factor 2 family protein [Microbacterium sp. RD1]|uniref:nuclear transport factor 2 family protein n=1 Tax=Microbacterium sp. RD1 TaxID=3457313 RepID=UPI003FA5BAE7